MGACRQKGKVLERRGKEVCGEQCLLDLEAHSFCYASSQRARSQTLIAVFDEGCFGHVNG